jgi:hypothetical protein
MGTEFKSTELEISNGFAKLTVNLGEFLSVAQLIVGITKHREARQALKDAILEIRKSCDTAVDVFTPLYALTDTASFTKSFGALHANFKNSYLKNINTVRTNCKIVKTHLDALLKKKGWIARLPLLKRSYFRLDQLCKNWFYQDMNLARQMETFLRSINDFYADISNLAQQDSSMAFSLLRSGLEQFEDDFLSLRKKLGALDVLSKTI